MIGVGLSFGCGLLPCLGVVHGLLQAFLVIKGNGWLPLAEHTMAQCLPLVQHGDGVIKRLTDRDLGAAKAVAFVLSGQLGSRAASSNLGQGGYLLGKPP